MARFPSAAAGRVSDTISRRLFIKCPAVMFGKARQKTQRDVVPFNHEGKNRLLEERKESSGSRAPTKLSRARWMWRRGSSAPQIPIDAHQRPAEGEERTAGDKVTEGSMC